MSESRSPVPSMKALLAFEAVMRLGSITAAAAELGSTQPAISQRVRSLEDALGLPLFDRDGRRVLPTRAGRRYYDEVGEAVLDITRASRRLRSRAQARGRELVIAAHFGLVHLWLLPRLARLESAFPATRFDVVPVDQDGSPEMMSADLTIRFGALDERAENEQPLFEEAVYPVCSPGFGDRYALCGTVTAAELAATPLLHMDHEDPRWLDWHRWCELAGLPSPGHPPRFRYNNYPLLLNAAVEGEGLALGWDELVRPLVREGTLMPLNPVIRRSSRGYLLGARNPDAASVAPVVDWLRREGGASD
ncbi:MAG: LysR family transcriptional regulator [Arhodomonas sp.]|nr:LysR family transcriptional regulator [Arhodomonas sp.]